MLLFYSLHYEITATTAFQRHLPSIFRQAQKGLHDQRELRLHNEEVAGHRYGKWKTKTRLHTRYDGSIFNDTCTCT